MAPTLLRAALRSSLQSSAAICQISMSSPARPAALAPAQMCARLAKGRRRALQQRLDEGYAFRQLVRARFCQSHILGAAVSSADAEHGACIRDVVARDHRRRHPGIHGISRRVGNADHGVAVAVGALGELLAKVEGVGPEEETNLHLPLSTRHRVIAAARSLRLFAKTTA